MANQTSVANKLTEISFDILKNYSSANRIPVDVANGVQANITQQAMQLAQDFITHNSDNATITALQEYMVLYINAILKNIQQANNGFNQNQNNNGGGWNNNQNNNGGGWNNNQNNGSWNNNQNNNSGGWNNNQNNNGGGWNNNQNNNTWGGGNNQGFNNSGVNNYGSFGSGNTWNSNGQAPANGVVYGDRQEAPQVVNTPAPPAKAWTTQTVPNQPIPMTNPTISNDIGSTKVKLKAITNTASSPSKGKVSFEGKEYSDDKDVRYELNRICIKDVVCSEEDAIALASTVKNVHTSNTLNILKYDGSVVLDVPVKEITTIHTKLKELLTGVAVLANDACGNYAAIVNVLTGIDSPASKAFEQLLVTSFNDRLIATNVCDGITISELTDISELLSGSDESIRECRRNTPEFTDIIQSVCRISLQQFILEELTILNPNVSKDIDDVITAIRTKVTPSGKSYLGDYWKLMSTSSTNKKAIELLKEIKIQLSMYTVLRIPRSLIIANDCETAVDFTKVDSNILRTSDDFSALELLVYDGTKAFPTEHEGKVYTTITKIKCSISDVKYTLRYVASSDGKSIILTRSDGKYEL